MIFGIFIFIVGIAMLFDPDPDDSGVAPSIAIASTAFIIPGVLLIALGKRAHKEEEQLESLVSIAKSYRRITMDELSQNLNIPVERTGKLLSLAISKKLIKGNFDRTTDEFFTEDSKLQEINFRFCPSCGAPFDRVYLEGETIKCKNCGVLIG